MFKVFHVFVFAVWFNLLVDVKKTPPTSCRGKRETNGSEKFLVVKRLGEKSRSPSIQGRGTNQQVVYSREDDDTR